MPNGQWAHHRTHFSNRLRVSVGVTTGLGEGEGVGSIVVQVCSLVPHLVLALEGGDRLARQLRRFHLLQTQEGINIFPRILLHILFYPAFPFHKIQQTHQQYRLSRKFDFILVIFVMYPQRRK